MRAEKNNFACVACPCRQHLPQCVAERTRYQVPFAAARQKCCCTVMLLQLQTLRLWFGSVCTPPLVLLLLLLLLCATYVACVPFGAVRCWRYELVTRQPADGCCVLGSAMHWRVKCKCWGLSLLSARHVAFVSSPGLELSRVLCSMSVLDWVCRLACSTFGRPGGLSTRFHVGHAILFQALCHALVTSQVAPSPTSDVYLVKGDLA